MKQNDYVEARENSWYVRGSRVSLDSVVYAFRDGLSPEAIASECFPTLSLEQVYGAITAYLANRAELDAYLEVWKARGQAERQAQRASDSSFADRMARARREQWRATA